MSKFEKSVIALLLAIAGCSAVTAVEVAKLVERGLDVEISPADAADWWDGLSDKRKVEIYYQNE